MGFFFFSNTRRVDVSKFLVENTADFDTPATKTDIVTFLETKRLFARTTYIRLLIYLKAIYGQKKNRRKSIIQLLPLDGRYFLTVAVKNFASPKMSFSLFLSLFLNHQKWWFAEPVQSRLMCSPVVSIVKSGKQSLFEITRFAVHTYKIPLVM